MDKILPKNNVLLVKDDIGRAKPCTFKLPKDGHIYGRPNHKNEEGVGAITSKWQLSSPSRISSTTIPSDFKKLNKQIAKDLNCDVRVSTLASNFVQSIKHNDRFKVKFGDHSVKAGNQHIQR